MRNDKFNLTINQLFKGRLHLGHKNSKLNKNMLVYILGNRHNINIFNLEKILYNLQIFFNAFVEITSQRGFFFIIGNNTNLPMDDVLESLYNKYNINKKSNFIINGYTIDKWFGGIFSNWRGTYDFVNYMLNSPKIKTTRYQNYLHRLKGFERNALVYQHIPDFLLMLSKDSLAIKEAQNLNIPIMGLADSNVNSIDYTYLLPGNDDSLESITFLCNFIEQAVEEGFNREQEQFLYYFISKIQQNITKN